MSINRGGCALTGDWNKLRNFIKSGQEYIDLANDVIREEAEKIRDSVEKEIPFYRVPNADSTIRRKGKNAPLEESGVFKSQGIVVNEYGSRDKGYKKYFVVQGNDSLHVDTGGRNHEGISYKDLLEIMENGASNTGRGSNIPPRPVLTITFDRLKGQLESEIIGKVFSKVHEAIRE